MLITPYAYSTLGLLERITNIDGLTLTYSYTSNRASGPFRVSRVEISNGGVYFGGRKYVYGDCLTKVIDLVPNDNGTALMEGKALVYRFNDYGNVISVNDEFGYACFAKYSDALPANHPEVTSKMQRTVVNLLQNHNFESDSGWSFTNSNSAAGNAIIYSNDSPYMGKRCVKATVLDGSRCDMQQWVTLECGKTYTLSFFAKCTGSMAVWLETYTDNEGWTAFERPSIEASSAYQRYHNSFTVPGSTGTCNVNIGICLGDGYGSAWVDCVQLEKGPVANSYNMLINGDFTLNSGAHPTGWSKNSSNTSMDIVYPSCTGTKPEGLSSNTMRMYGTGRTKYAGIYQDIPFSGNQGDVFSAGGWSLNFSKPRKGENFRYNIRVAFLKAGTSTRVNSESIEWGEEWTDWQFAAGPVVAPCNYTSVRFNVDYERNINYAEFNGLFLHKEEFGKTFAYDDKGNVTSTKNLASMQSYATYDDYNNLLTYRQPGRPASDKYTLEYGATAEEKKKHLLVKSTSPLDIQHTYAYDNKGNVLTQQTQNSTASAFIKGEITYTADQNYVATQADARGKVVTSNIDPATSTLTSVQDPNGQTVNYAYDIMKRITDVHTTADGKTYKNAYSYANDKLMQVSHNTDSDTACDVQYNFAYDAAGRPTTVKVCNSSEWYGIQKWSRSIIAQ